MRDKDQRGTENWLLIKEDDAYAATEKDGTVLLDMEHGQSRPAGRSRTSQPAT